MLMDLLKNDILICAFIAWAVAQFGKTLLLLIRRKEVDVRQLLSAGGMPSTHSATVSALTTGVARVCGLSSTAFSISLVLSIIVIYDAIGVRYSTGCHAKIINKLARQEHLTALEEVNQEPLNERLGHTVREMLCGVALGVLIALIYPF